MKNVALDPYLTSNNRRDFNKDKAPSKPTYSSYYKYSNQKVNNKCSCFSPTTRSPHNPRSFLAFTPLISYLLSA